MWENFLPIAPPPSIRKIINVLKVSKVSPEYEHGWNDTDWRKPNNWKTYLPMCQEIHHESHIDTI
jgi:hypothetical protein